MINRLNQIVVFQIILVSYAISCGKVKSENTHDTQSLFAHKLDSTKWIKPSHGIREILEDRNGNLWFSNREFVCRFDGSEFTYFDSNNGFNGIGTNMHEDAIGNIWIETNIGDSLYGVSIYDGSKFIFQAYPSNKQSKAVDVSEKDIWFSKPIKSTSKWSDPPGSFRYQNGEFDLLEFPVPIADDYENKYWATSKTIRGKDGTLWFGTIEAVIGYKEGNFTIIDRNKMGRIDDPVPVGIRGIFVDEEGKLWMADNGSGIYVFDGDSVTNFTRQHRLGKNKKKGNTLHRAFSIAEDNNGNMWFGTVYSGIWRYHTASNEFTNYGIEDGVLSDCIWKIHKTKNGNLLFLGESPGAVYQFNGKSFDRVF
ncbi:ligand-binding sensor domain-containing protein [Ekhidna sp.]|uniref:ligand-binding sensor domain-containing protein n=1 Tax=Ekhidna sp. TaxID=2608089 RepID=UPI003BA8485F